MKNELVRKILYFVFPNRCKICGDVVSLSEDICENCKTANRISLPRCDKCGREKSSCKCKLSSNTAEYEKIIAPFYYDEHTTKAIHRLKFGGYSELVDGMSDEMVKTIKQEYNHINFDAITYVPLSKKREKARGYNQSYILAQALSQKLSIPLEHTFYKTYENPPQRNQSAKRRKANVFATFDINENIDVKEKTYLIVDDVKTTGSTLSECAATLDTFGATATYACTFAIR